MPLNEQIEELGKSMISFVMRDLVGMVMKKKALTLEDALHYIYTSRMYMALQDESTKLWYSSTLSLYEDLEKEKSASRKSQKADNNVLLFQMYCVENYQSERHLSAMETLTLFSNNSVFEFLNENFEMLHTQDLKYILDSIVAYIKTKK